jgi:hypothetical protein
MSYCCHSPAISLPLRAAETDQRISGGSMTGQVTPSCPLVSESLLPGPVGDIDAHHRFDTADRSLLPGTIGRQAG